MTVARHPRDLGVRVGTEEIVTSAWAAARYLDHAGIRAVSAVGSEGLSAELRGRGVRLTEDEPERRATAEPGRPDGRISGLADVFDASVRE